MHVPGGIETTRSIICANKAQREQKALPHKKQGVTYTIHSGHFFYTLGKDDSRRNLYTQHRIFCCSNRTWPNTYRREPKASIPIHFVNSLPVPFQCFISICKVQALEGRMYKQASCLFLPTSADSTSDGLPTKILAQDFFTQKLL